ncbi:hypothetical protein CR513_52220, partial [Mucuna pruriens]
MENFLRSQEFLNLIDPRIPQHADGAVILDNEKKNLEELKLKDLKNGESINDYFAQTLTIANKMRMFGEKMSDLSIIEKILRSMTVRYDYVVCSIEESHNLDSMTVDEL